MEERVNKIWTLLGILLVVALAVVCLVGCIHFCLEGPKVVHAAAPDAPAARSIHVCREGPPSCDYSDLATALWAATDGDVIKVSAGILHRHQP